MFDQILVPVDGSSLAEHILPDAAAMARAFGSQVRLVSVLDPFEGVADQFIDSWAWRIRLAEAEAYLKELSGRLNDLGIPTQTTLLEGKAPDQVLRQALASDASLIMLSSHGQGGISDWNLSSVVAKIIQQARTSVMIVRSYSPQEQHVTDLRYRRILAPFDGSQRAEYGLFAAARLARAHDSELVIAHVVKPPELPRRTPLSIQDQNLRWQVIESNRAEASQTLSRLKSSLDCRVDTRLLVSDRVAEALHALVEQEGVDLVVLNAHGFSGNPGRPYGNVASDFLVYGMAPLLIVQDFASEQLGHTDAQTYAQTFLAQPRPVLEALQPGTREGSQ